MHPRATLLALFILVACAPVARHSAAPTPPTSNGWEVGSGGGECKSEWVDAVHTAQAILDDGALPEVASSRFATIVDKTSILYKRQVFLDPAGEQEMAAVNFAQATPQRIELGCESFLKLRTEQKVELVVHEVASLLGLDDREKQVSGRLDVARVCSRTEKVKDLIERSVGKACNIIRAHDLNTITSLDLNGSHIAALKPNDFAGLTELRRLDLRGNNLHTLPPRLFAETGLRVISGLSSQTPSDFWDNPITKLERGFLGPNSRATEIVLCPASYRGEYSSAQEASGSGFITEIEAGAFAGINPEAHVTLCLNLSPQSTISPAALSDLFGIKSLTIIGFGLVRFPIGFFSRAQTTKLEILELGLLNLPVLNEINQSASLSRVVFYLPRVANFTASELDAQLNPQLWALTRYECLPQYQFPTPLPGYVARFVTSLSRPGFSDSARLRDPDEAPPAVICRLKK